MVEINYNSNIKDKNVKQKSIAELVPKYQGIFAKEVLLNRAIPRLEDGLKPVQRRAVYMANLHHLNSTAKHMKVAKLSGLVLALHPHGDSSVNQALTTLSRQWELNLPIIDIHGNNGSVVGTEAAASRYIEARLTKAAELLMDTINMDSVDMVDNFDNTMKEPELLPAKWPVALINGSTGIGWGMSTNILPHNPDEIMDALIEIAKNPKITLKKLQTIIKGPDFPTGGIIVGHSDAKEELKDGTGKFTVRAKAEIDDKNNEIVITEVPYRVSTTALVSSMNKALEQYRIPLSILSIDDETAADVKVVVRFKKSATHKQMETALSVLYSNSNCEENLSANTLMVVNNMPKVIGIKDALIEFLVFRKKTYRRELNFQYNKLADRLNIVEALIKLIDIADEVIVLAKKCDGKDDLSKKLQKKYKFNQAQADAIASMPIYKLGKQNALALKKEYEDKKQQYDEINHILNNEKAFNQAIIKELKQTKKAIGTHPRKTQIISKDDIEITNDVDTTSLIKEQDTLVVVKKDGIIQRMSEKVYDNNVDKYKDKDKIITTCKAKTTDGMIFYTRNGLTFYRLVDEIENQNVKSDVASVQTVITSYKANDEILTCSPIKKDKSKKYIISVTESGMVKVGKEADEIPSTKTKAYIKKTKKYNGLKVKDDIVKKVFIVSQQELKKKKLVIVRTDDKKISMSLDKLTVQGASGSGANKGKFTKKFTYKDCYLK